MYSFISLLCHKSVTLSNLFTLHCFCCVSLRVLSKSWLIPAITDTRCSCDKHIGMGVLAPGPCQAGSVNGTCTPDAEGFVALVRLVIPKITEF